MINKVELQGRIASEPTVKEFPNGKILMFTVVVSEKFKDKKSGQEKEVAHFFDVEVIGSAASTLVSKGDVVVIRGSLRQDRWTTSSGEKRSKVKIVVFEVEKKTSDKTSSTTNTAKANSQTVEQKTTTTQQTTQAKQKVTYKTYKKAA